MFIACQPRGDSVTSSVFYNAMSCIQPSHAYYSSGACAACLSDSSLYEQHIGLCRYGTVVVKAGAKELSTLGRGKFVGERTLVTGKLRSADCVARTRVTAIVMQKREFLEVDNPMLDWMIPYDAARAVLKEQPEVAGLAAEQFETLLDRVGAKMEAQQGEVIVAKGTPIDVITVFITGMCELVNEQGKVRAM